MLEIWVVCPFFFHCLAHGVGAEVLYWKHETPCFGVEEVTERKGGRKREAFEEAGLAEMGI